MEKYDGVILKPTLDEALEHYGVKGMKWKKRKANIKGKLKFTKEMIDQIPYAWRHRNSPNKGSLKDYALASKGSAYEDHRGYPKSQRTANKFLGSTTINDPNQNPLWGKKGQSYSRSSKPGIEAGRQRYKKKKK